jgi:hypothetical protein
LAQYSIKFISCIINILLNTLSSPFQNSWWRGIKTQEYLQWNFFCIIYMTYFLRVLYKKPAVWVYISPPQFSTIKRTWKRYLNVLWEMKHEENWYIYNSESFASAITAIQNKQ